MSLSISVIIPTFQDYSALKTLLERLTVLQPTINEIIVVDANEQLLCADICNSLSIVCLSTKPCRGFQLDEGAKSANSDIFWFLHADSVPEFDAVEVIQNQLKNEVIGGFFKFKFSGQRSWRLRVFEYVTNLRSKYGVAYGDQGLFVHREAYFEAGGFTHQPLFEEVRLIRRLRKIGTFKAVKQALPTSARRWQQGGWWRRTLLNRLLAVAHALGVPAERLHRWYENWRV